MPIVERTIVYHDLIGIGDADLVLVRQGKKTCTIRLGTANVDQNVIYLGYLQNKVLVRVLYVENGRLYHDLTDRDAQQDGHISREDLYEDLKQFYGSIDPQQPMTLIHFELL
jgi:hypothetical protein